MSTDRVATDAAAFSDRRTRSRKRSLSQSPELSASAAVDTNSRSADQIVLKRARPDTQNAIAARDTSVDRQNLH